MLFAQPIYIYMLSVPTHLIHNIIFTINFKLCGWRPGQTAHCLQVRDRKWGARGPSGRLASAKLVIHIKYCIFIIYLYLHHSLTYTLHYHHKLYQLGG